MATPLALFLRMRLAAVMLLAAILLQAGLPLGAAPLERTSGAAWSAGTLEVAIATTRKAQAGAEAVETAPMAVAPAAPRLLAAKTIAVSAALPEHRWPENRGPPPRQHPARLPDSTAPPLA